MVHTVSLSLLHVNAAIGAARILVVRLTTIPDASCRSTIIGATCPEQLEENLQAFCEPLGQGVLEEIDQVYLRHRDPSLED